MKSVRKFWLLVVMVMALASLFAVSASAATELPGGTTVENVMQFAGIEAEYTGLNGIRAVFTVKDSELKKLEDAGYTVTYGALVGYRANYVTADKLTLETATENAATIAVYKTGASKKEAYFLDSESGVSRFAIATFFGSKAETVDARRGLTYRGYIQLERSGYTAEVYYVDAKSLKPDTVISLYNTLEYASENGYFNKDNIFLLLDRFEQVTDVYVNPNASASGDGLSSATAVKTLKEGYEKAVALINASDKNIDVVVNLASGKYLLTEKLNLKGADITASVEYSITFRGSKNKEKSVITSNVDISASEFKKVSGTRYYEYQLPDSAKIDGKYPAFRDLYIDGELATLAQSKGDFTMLLDSCSSIDKNDTYGLKKSDRLLYVSMDALGAIDVDEDGNVIGDLEFWVQTDWQVHCVHIEHIDYDGSEVIDTRDGKNEVLIPIRVKKSDWEAFDGQYYSTLKNRRYWFVNNKSFLDEKGEFWYDEANGKIYMIPFGDIKNVDVVSYPLCERLIHMDGVQNITFQNLDFTGTTVNYITKYAYITGQGGYLKREWTNPDTGKKESRIFLPYGAIYGKDVENLRLSECSIYGTGGDGINLRGAVDRVRIYDSSFETIGGCAIRLGVNNADFNTAQHNQNIIIRENFMQNLAVNFNSATGILVSSVKDMEIMQNTILDSAYSAISVGWLWGTYPGHVNVENTKIEYNYIENFMTKTQDGGAIYSLGGNAPEQKTYDADFKSSVSHNYVVLTPETGNGSGHWTVFYHDQGSSHWLDEGNILVAGPDAQGTDHHYVSFQSISPGVCNIKNDGMIFIGEYKAEKPYANEVSNPDGSKSYNDKALSDRYNQYINWYRFETFAAMAGTEQETIVRETAEMAGCAAYKPVYGEWSAKK